MGRVKIGSDLGDQASFCVDCGWARRYMPTVAEPESTCPACGGVVISECPECAAAIPTVMTVECAACGTALRDRQASGTVQIRRGTRRIEVLPDA